MPKQKKKRNKAYTGSGAAIVRPTVTRVQAVNRSKMGQWWYDNKKFARPAGIVAGIVAVIIIVISGVISIFTSL